MADNDYVRILNISRQMICIQTRRPNSDFYLDEQQVRLSPGKDIKLSRSHLMMDQIDNLCKRGILRIVSSSTNGS